jgi:hypothetical protein
MDSEVRRREIAYNVDPSVPTLRSYNIALERAGMHTFLPMEHLQMLFEDITKLLYYRPGRGGGDPRLATVDSSGRYGDVDCSDYRVIQGWCDDFEEVKFDQPYFRVVAYNLYDPSGEHINANIEISRQSIGRTGGTESNFLSIFVDDSIYLLWKARRGLPIPGSPKVLSSVLSLHQPWIYSAKDLLMFSWLDQLNLLIDGEPTDVDL